MLINWPRILIKLSMLCMSLLISLLISLTVAGQTTTTAPIFPAIQNAPADSCEAKLDLESRRLEKVLDAYDKSQKALGFAMDEIAARKNLDALKDQIIVVKDLIIASQDELIKRLSKKKSGIWNRIEKILEIAEKVALIGVGVAVGHGL